MDTIKVLEIGHIDDFDTELIIHIELNMYDEERESFGKNIDKENYLQNCWLVMVTMDKEKRCITGNELYYVSNMGLEVSEKQLSEEETRRIYNFVLGSEEVLQWK